MSPRLVLASTSAGRRALLERLGLPFSCRAPEVNEDDWKARFQDPDTLVQALAEAKARAAARPDEDAWVIGADQVGLLDGERLDKPGDVAAARRQLARLAGRTHTLHTGWFILRTRDGVTRSGVDRHTLHMRPLTAAEIEAYVDRDDPVGCAGSYKLEGLGVCLFEEVRGTDSTAVVGLPLMAITAALRELGLDVLREKQA